MRDDLLRAANDPRLDEIEGVDRAWVLGYAAHLTALLNDWLRP